jgi:DNA damage-binding protein 1
MAAHLYYATSQKPGCVTHSAVGSFTSPAALNLILGLGTRLEIYNCGEGGLTAVASVPLFGRVATMSLVRPSFHSAGAPALLMVVTERNQFMVLRWDAAAQSLVTEASGDLRVR